MYNLSPPSIFIGTGSAPGVVGGKLVSDYAKMLSNFSTKIFRAKSSKKDRRDHKTFKMRFFFSFALIAFYFSPLGVPIINKLRQK